MQRNALTECWATALKIARNKRAAFTYRYTKDAAMRSRIAMFHDILPNGESNDDPYACELSTLMHSIDRHIDKGFRFVSMDELLATPEEEAQYGRIVLTFDDGFERVYTLAAPVLEAHSIPFTVYITTDFLNRAPYLSRDQLLALAEEPLCTIGAHTLSHPMTRFLTAPEAAREISECKTVLEEMLCREVRHFAFPYGSAYACSARDILLAQRAGYVSAALTAETFLPRRFQQACYRLPRMNMPKCETSDFTYRSQRKMGHHGKIQ